MEWGKLRKELFHNSLSCYFPDEIKEDEMMWHVACMRGGSIIKEICTRL